MTWLRRRFLILLLIAMAGPPACGQQVKIEIDGSVTDGSGTGIAGVRVRVYRLGRRVAETRTNKDGKYNLSVDNGRPFDTVRYDHTEWHPGVVQALHGGKHQHINKVLLPPKGKLTFLNSMDQLLVYEQLYWLEQLAPEGPNIGRLQEEYGGKLTSLLIPDQISDRKADVLRLYGFDE